METKRLIEIRSYKLITGSGASFHQAVVSEAIPLLRSRGADVVSYLNTVLWLSPEGVEDMRRLNGGAAAHPCTDDRE